MKILLIYPSRLDEKGLPIRYINGYLPPLVLAQLAALTPPEHHVAAINAAIEDIPYDTRWDVVAITALTPEIEHGYKIADEFRSMDFPPIVIIGGIHATLLPEEAAQHADVVVVGEAETIWRKV